MLRLNKDTKTQIARALLAAFLAVSAFSGVLADETKLDSSTFKQILEQEIEQETKDMSQAEVLDYEKRAWCYFQLGDYEKAVADYSEAIRENSSKHRTSSAPYFGRASAYRALNKYTDALADYKQANKEHVKAFVNLFTLCALSTLLMAITVFFIIHKFLGHKRLSAWIFNKGKESN